MSKRFDRSHHAVEWRYKILMVQLVDDVAKSIQLPCGPCKECFEVIQDVLLGKMFGKTDLNDLNGYGLLTLCSLGPDLHTDRKQ